MHEEILPKPHQILNKRTREENGDLYRSFGALGRQRPSEAIWNVSILCCKYLHLEDKLDLQVVGTCNEPPKITSQINKEITMISNGVSDTELKRRKPKRKIITRQMNGKRATATTNQARVSHNQVTSQITEISQLQTINKPNER